MQTTYQIIGTNGIIRMNEIDWPKEPSFQQMARLVNPLLQIEGKPEAFSEHVRVWHEGQYVSMFVDDSGSVKRLPVNQAATEIYWANMMENDPSSPKTLEECKAAGWPAIHGTAILFNRNVWA